jgi:protein-L-isoaspartate(D-aspartate) O-methyltransferase
MQPVSALILAAVAANSAPMFVQSDTMVVERQRLVEVIEARASSWHFPRDRSMKAAIDAIGRTPRHLFVPETAKESAYLDTALPIGYEQTISAPSIVAVMTALLRVSHDDRVLEIGTGSGYQAAVLSPLVHEVYTIEIVEPLAHEAAARLKQLGFANVQARAGDGYAGWSERAPFDAIIVTAGAAEVPQPLLDQLKPGGRLVIPLGPNWAQLELMRFVKRKDGTVTKSKFGQVFFVPFTRQQEKREANP